MIIGGLLNFVGGLVTGDTLVRVLGVVAILADAAATAGFGWVIAQQQTPQMQAGRSAARS